MSTEFTQEHYEIVRITLPAVEGACTISGEPGYSTALTCDQDAGTTKTYSFTSESAPIVPESPLYRVLQSISETVTKLDPNKGLASRGTISIKLRDFIADPNPESPAVLANPQIKEQGTFFGKLAARNILVNKPLVIELHSVTPSGGTYPVPFQSRNYIIEGLNNNGNGTWTLKGKDELSAINFDEFQYPPSPQDAFLRQDITENTTTIPVDSSTAYAVGNVILVGDEFMKITATSNIGNSNASLTVQARGTDIFGTQSNFLTSTERETHSAGDTIFICNVSDNITIDEWLLEFFTLAGVPNDILTNSQPAWADEVSEWHPNTRINTLWYKPEDANDALKSVLTAYMMDLWYEPTTQLIRLTAVSQWRESDLSVIEGRGVTYDTLKFTTDEKIRATRAIAVYDKRFLSRSDDIENYRKLEVFTDTELESEDFFGKPKDFRFENSRLLSDESAALLVQRRVRRFGRTPVTYAWECEERFLDYATGDVVDIISPEIQGFNGLAETNRRAQVLSVQPQYNKPGRLYKVNALTYAPELTEDNGGLEVISNTTITDFNVFERFGGPNERVSVTLVLDNVIVRSTTNQTPAIRAGSFPPGSVITIILVNGTDWQAKGGDGGNGGGSFFEPQTGRWIPDGNDTGGADGGTCYADDGIQTNIYLSGATGEPSYPTANGFLRAPGGGGGGASSAAPSPTRPSSGSTGGGAGAGNLVGVGGVGGRIIDQFGAVAAPTGAGGQNGDTQGNGGQGGTPNFYNGGDWGQPGQNGINPPGAAGKGLSGNVTWVSGATASNFINGGGDAPATGAFSIEFSEAYG